MSKFSWGKVIDNFALDFGGAGVLKITKYLPTKFVNGVGVRGEYDNEPLYHSESLSESATSIELLVISWIARKNLGLNQHNLVTGVARALAIEE